MAYWLCAYEKINCAHNCEYKGKRCCILPKPDIRTVDYPNKDIMAKAVCYSIKPKEGAHDGY
jgi:hypothetical protein